MRKVLFLVASCCLMTACDLEDRLIAKAEEKYDESFKEVFGKIDPEHTWSMVENKAVSVNLDESSRVKIYVKVDRTYYLVGDYQNVSGCRELAFDAPRGCEDIMVTVNGAPYQKDGSRAILCSNNPSEIVYADNSTDEHVKYHYYTYGQIKAFHGDVGHLPENKPNDSRIKKDYLLVSEGHTYTFSPTYWNAVNDHKFGLFYYTNYDKMEYVTIPFYQNKGGGYEHNELQYKSAWTGNWVSLKENYAYYELFGMVGAPKYEDDDEMLRAQHFHINIPEKTIFGFYVETNGSTFFSDSRLNSKVDGGNPEFSAFGHIEIDGFTYIVVEDIDYTKNPNPTKEPDYNDFVFTMKGVHEHINTTEPISYLYATEDLGGTDDYDFNDVIFSVAHVSGQPKATVKLMAAGGILPTEIWFEDNNSAVSTKVGKEIHEAFGVGTTTMVNTTSITKEFVTLGEVEVGENWSHLAFTNAGNGFKVKVKVKKNLDPFEVGTPGANNGEAPQMLILNRDWLWPTERTSINTAYPDFGEWGANYLDYLWVNNWVSSKVVDRDLTDEYPHAH